MKQKLSTFALVLSALAVGLLALAACNVSAAPSQSLEPAGQSESASEPLPQMAQGEAAFTGVVEAIELDTYTVGGAIFKIDADSQRPADLTVGAAVQIRAHVDPDGSFYAQVISPAPAASGSPPPATSASPRPTRALAPPSPRRSATASPWPPTPRSSIFSGRRGSRR